MGSDRGAKRDPMTERFHMRHNPERLEVVSMSYSDAREKTSVRFVSTMPYTVDARDAVVLCWTSLHVLQAPTD